MSSIKKNFIYNLILTVSGYVFTFLTFPYISRVLGVENIGAINFVDSIINYFIIISMLGVSIIGIREIAKNKNNKEELENTFRDIFFPNAIITIITILILICCIFTIPKFNNYKLLLIIGIIRLFFNFTLVEWFFAGIENFKFVTIRSLFIKSFYVILVFLLVKNKEDQYIYYALTTLMIVINAIMNWIYLSKLITIKIKGLKIGKYIKSIFSLGGYMVLTSLYVNFTTVYLGLTSGDKEVGYYTTASKLYSILLSVFTSFTGIMLPRMSFLISQNKFEEFKLAINKSYDLLFLFSFPLVIWSIIFSPQIILLIAGKGYEGAIIPMRIIMPLMVIIGYAQILVVQILMPLRKDKVILYNSFIGAVFGLALNFLIVNKLKSIGSSIVWLACELLLVILSQYFITKKFNIKFPSNLFLKHFYCSIPISIIIFYFNKLNISYPIINITIGLFLIFTYYMIINITILKNKIILDLQKNIIKKIKI